MYVAMPFKVHVHALKLWNVMQHIYKYDIGLGNQLRIRNTYVRMAKKVLLIV